MVEEIILGQTGITGKELYAQFQNDLRSDRFQQAMNLYENHPCVQERATIEEDRILIEAHEGGCLN